LFSILSQTFFFKKKITNQLCKYYGRQTTGQPQ
jgi:hypothetical protein